MNHKIISTEEFWDKMGDPRFIRLSPHKGQIGNTVYHISTSPEEIPGFISDKLQQILQHLGVKHCRKPLKMEC